MFNEGNTCMKSRDFSGYNSVVKNDKNYIKTLEIQARRR